MNCAIETSKYETTVQFRDAGNNSLCVGNGDGVEVEVEGSTRDNQHCSSDLTGVPYVVCV